MKVGESCRSEFCRRSSAERLAQWTQAEHVLIFLGQPMIDGKPVVMVYLVLARMRTLRCAAFFCVCECSDRLTSAGRNTPGKPDGRMILLYVAKGLDTRLLRLQNIRDGWWVLEIVH